MSNGRQGAPDPATRRIALGAYAANAVANASIFFQPLLLADLVAMRRLDMTQAGLALTVEMLAAAAAAATAARLCRGWTLRAIALLGALVAAAGGVASIASSGYAALLCARVVCGLGEGAALLVASAAPAGLPNPDRVYARANIATILIGSLLVYVAPDLGRLVGGPSAFPAMLVCCLVLLPVLALLPAEVRYQPAAADGSARVSLWRSAGALWLAFLLFVMTSAGITSLDGLFGARVGLDGAAVSGAIAASILSALAGSAAADLLGTRAGRVAPLMFGVILVGLCLFALAAVADARVYRLSLCLQMAGVYFVLPYFLGVSAARDGSGRGVAALNATIPLAYSIGPVCGALAIERLGAPAIAWAGLAIHGAVIALALRFVGSGEGRGWTMDRLVSSTAR